MHKNGPRNHSLDMLSLPATTNNGDGGGSNGGKLSPFCRSVSFRNSDEPVVLSFSTTDDDDSSDDDDFIPDEPRPSIVNNNKNNNKNNKNNKMEKKTSTSSSVAMVAVARNPALRGCCWLFTEIKKYYDRWGLKHLLPLVILTFYALAGAGIFYSFERQNELDAKEARRQHLDVSRDALVRNLTLLYRRRVSEQTRFRHAKRMIMRYEEQEKIVVGEQQIEWTYVNAVFYAGTVFTTIGYGNIVPVTVGGRIFTIFFAILGIPLVLAILNDLGKLCSKWLHIWWKRLIVFLQSRKVNEKLPKVIRESKLTSKLHLERQEEVQESSEPPSESHSATNVDENGQEDEDGNENEDEDDDHLPVLLALFLTVSWIFVCAAIFLIWESKWTYWTSFYFFFVSLTTIGLGDVVPEHPNYMIGNFYMIIVGLSLVSMTINVMQRKIESILFRMIKMLREEYNKIMEQEGDITNEDKTLALEKVWAQQPLFVRMFLPHVMTEAQEEKLEEENEQLSKEVLVESFYQRQLDSDFILTPRCRSAMSNRSHERRSLVAFGIGESDFELLAASTIDEVQSVEVQTDTQLLMGVCDACIQASYVEEDDTSKDSQSSQIQEAIQTEPPDLVSQPCQTEDAASIATADSQCQYSEDDLLAMFQRLRSLSLQAGDGDISIDPSQIRLRSRHRNAPGSTLSPGCSVEYPNQQGSLAVAKMDNSTNAQQSFEDMNRSPRGSVTVTLGVGCDTTPDIIPERDIVELVSRAAQTTLEGVPPPPAPGASTEGSSSPNNRTIMKNTLTQTDLPRNLGFYRDCTSSVSLSTAERPCQTEPAPVREVSTNTMKVYIYAKSPRKQLSTQHFDVDVQTDPARRKDEMTSREIQTIDSYLKIARRLEELKMNRAKSLYISVAPNVRKVGRQDHNNVERKSSKALKVPEVVVSR